MTKTELIVHLIRYRLVRNGVKLGMSGFEAEREAEAVISEKGLQGWFGGMRASSTPEGAIVLNVQTYVSILEARGCLQPDVTDVTLTRVHCDAIIAIEQNRRKKWPGSHDYPFYLQEYTYYRTCVEVRALFGIEPDQMGLDRETVAGMTETALDYFLAHRSKTIPSSTKIEPQRGNDITVTAFVPLNVTILGGPFRVSLPNGRAFDVAIPAGTRRGRQLRLKGQGEAGRGGGDAGDAIITIALAHRQETFGRRISGQ